MMTIQQMIGKYDSNWFYCAVKDKYGNDIRYLLKEIVEDLREVENDKQRSK